MNSRADSARRGRRERGFTLIEVLVALVILAIGALGLIAMQLQGMRFNQDAFVRNQATDLAYDIIERMRNNPDQADSYIVAADPGGACDPTGAGISNDLDCWYDDLASVLPGSAASIAADPANPNGYLITISWADRDTGGNVTQQWAVEP